MTEEKKIEPVEARLNAFARLVALFLLGLGIYLLYQTNTTPLAATLTSIFYFVGVLFLGAGLTILLVKLE